MTTDPDSVYALTDPDDDDPCDRPEHLARVAALARTFPSLARVEHPRLAGRDPFDPDQLDNWTGGNDCTGQAYFAALFILQVTSAGDHWESETFNAVVAMLAWDEAHRRAFMAWAAEPWGGSR